MLVDDHRKGKDMMEEKGRRGETGIRKFLKINAKVSEQSTPHHHTSRANDMFKA